MPPRSGAPSSTNANAPPYGVRFRLKASFDETPYTANQKVVLRAMKTYGMILSDGGNIALTFADDRLSAAKWSSLGINAGTFASIGVSNVPGAIVGQSKVTPTDRAMADLISDYWVSFALTTDPNGGERPAWPRHDRMVDRLLHFTNSGVIVGTDPLKPRLDVWERVWGRER